jgi:hypothetical protein
MTSGGPPPFQPPDEHGEDMYTPEKNPSHQGFFLERLR